MMKELGAQFRAQSKSRQWLIASVLVILALITGLLCHAVLSPDLAVLFGELLPEDARQVASRLEQANIPFEVRGDGQEIRVDRQLVEKTRLQFTGNGLTGSRDPGFELFDKNDFGLTEHASRINYQRALQGELERTIASMDEIRSARVHLALPEKHLFDRTAQTPHAAVSLHLRRYLTRRQVEGIRAMVCASVTGLSPKQVVVVDQRGNILHPVRHSGTEGQWHEKQALERYLTDKTTGMLQAIFPDGRFMVRTDATLDFDAMERERVIPEASHILVHERTHEKTAHTAGKKTPAAEHTLEKQYHTGKSRERYSRAKGRIKRLAVSVAVPLTTSPQTLTRITHLVEAATGLDPARGDLLHIEAVIGENLLQDAEPRLHEIAPPPTPDVASRMPRAWIAAPLLLVAGCAAIPLRRKLLAKRRDQLLLELNDWLKHHEP